MVRQYIGARYVPKFCGEHTKSTGYEALSIVTDAVGNSYTSKKPVPINIELSDDEYWALTGSMSGAITDLQSRMNDAESDINTLEDDVTILKKPIMVAVGDSYLRTEVTTLASELENTLKVDLVNASISGMGYIRPQSGKTFIDLMEEVSEDIRLKTKYLLVYGGINDIAYSGNYDVINTAVNNFISSAKTHYPNAIIIIVGPQCDIAHISTSELIATKTAIEDACIGNGVIYADASNWLFNSPFVYSSVYTSDNVHPSNLGSKVIASKMGSLLYGLDNNCGLKMDFEVNDEGDTLTYSINGNIINFSYLSASKTFTKNSYVDLFHFNSIYTPFIQDALYPVCEYINGYAGVPIAGACKKSTNNKITMLYQGETFTGRIICTGAIIVGGNGTNVVHS